MSKLLLMIITFTVSSSFAANKSKCTYKLEKKSEKIGFTGYKFTEKAGVDGTFKSVRITTSENGAESLVKLVGGSSFWIDEKSFDAGNAARNKNITESLWDNIAGTTLSGHVLSINSKNKTLKIRLEMGKKDHDVEMKYTYEKQNFSAEGTIDLIKLGFNDAFSALEKKCAVLHKGKDGKSKTWSDVAIRVSAKITKNCN